MKTVRGTFALLAFVISMAAALHSFNHRLHANELTDEEIAYAAFLEADANTQICQILNESLWEQAAANPFDPNNQAAQHANFETLRNAFTLNKLQMNVRVQFMERNLDKGDIEYYEGDYVAPPGACAVFWYGFNIVETPGSHWAEFHDKYDLAYDAQQDMQDILDNL